MQLSVQEFAEVIRGNSDKKVDPGDKKDGPPSRWQIVVCQRGWVFVGRCEFAGDYTIINDAKCIRKWGTTSGLGQLAREGKLPDTILDEAGTVRVHNLSVVCSFDCSSKWGA